MIEVLKLDLHQYHRYDLEMDIVDSTNHLDLKRKPNSWSICFSFSFSFTCENRIRMTRSIDEKIRCRAFQWFSTPKRMCSWFSFTGIFWCSVLFRHRTKLDNGEHVNNFQHTLTKCSLLTTLNSAETLFFSLFFFSFSRNAKTKLENVSNNVDGLNNHLCCLSLLLFLSCFFFR